MSESLLRTLMQLFAIVANVNKESISTSSRNIVISYLKSFLPQNLVEHYFFVFEEYLHLYHSSIKNYSSRHSLHGIQLLKICHEINEQLQQSQKHVVLIQLLEFIRNGDAITEKELDFAETIASVFNIDDEEFIHCKSFVLDPDPALHTSILVVDGNTVPPEPHVKHITRQNLTGHIYFLKIHSTNMFFFRYTGNDSVYLNNQIIYVNRTYMFDPGATIRTSKTTALYFNEIAEKFSDELFQNSFTMLADNLNYTFRGSVNGIRNFNFSDRSGSIVGILGISGVGKSTLINLLNGKLKPEKGRVLVNNEDLNESSELHKEIIGYVPQDDMLIEDLSVFKNLYYNAELCFGNFSKEKILEKVNNTLKDFDLDDIRDLKVGSVVNKFISGGERKRLNLAIELIREPFILFVDEPTSGLSSTDSIRVMDILKEQALNGRLVIISIHQPSSEIYKMLDKLIVIDKGGRTIYQGNPIEAISYFKIASQQANFTTIQCETCGNLKPESVLQIVDSRVVDEYGRITDHRKTSPEEWVELYNQHFASSGIDKEFDKVPEYQFSKAGKFKQFIVFFKRDFFAKISNKQYLIISLFEAPLLAFIISVFCKQFSISSDGTPIYIFSQNENIPVFIFLSVIVAIFIGLTISVEEVFKDRKILFREDYLRLNRNSYFLSKIVLLFSLSLIQTFIYALVSMFILEIKGMFFLYWGILFSAAAYAVMMGLIVSKNIKSAITAYILIPILLIPQLLFCGVIVDFDKLQSGIRKDSNVPFLGELMISRWAFEALAVAQFKDNEYEKIFFEVEKNMSRYSFIFNFQIPALIDKINNCEEKIHNHKDLNKTFSDLVIVENEIDYLLQAFVPAVKPKRDGAEKFSEYKKYLLSLSKFSFSKYKRFKYEKEQLLKIYSAKTNLDSLKKVSHNEKLEFIVTNAGKPDKIVSGNDRLVPKFAPAFMRSDNKYLNVHFFASEKLFAGRYIDTYFINIGVIWFSNFLLYLVLIMRIKVFVPKKIRKYYRNE